MTSSHQEALFEMGNPENQGDQPRRAVSHIDLATQALRTVEVSDERLQSEIDKLGNVTLARARLGLPEETSLADREHTIGEPLPGKPLSYPKRGNVRDFHDGGRADEHRGGIGAPELGSDADEALQRKLPELVSMRDRIVEADIREGFEEAVIASEYLKVDSAKSHAVARYYGHITRHYPDMDSAVVRDLVQDFAETLIPPSPLQ